MGACYNQYIMHLLRLTWVKICIFIALFSVILLAALPSIRYSASLLYERYSLGCTFASGDTLHGCILKHFHDVAANAGTALALAEIKNDYERFPTVKHDCHRIMHAIGRAAAGGETPLPELFAEGDPFCWSGYYHGVVEGKMRGMQLSDITPEYVRHFCDAIPKTTENYFNHYNCIHGGGHAFMYVSKNEVFDSLDKCAYYLDEDDVLNCATGVFMENISAREEEGHATKYFKDDDLYYPCNAVTRKELKPICYEQQTTYFLLRSGRADTFEYCAHMPEAAYRNACYSGLGRNIAGEAYNDPDKTLAVCMTASTSEAKEGCIRGAVLNFISYFHSDTAARALCEKADASSREQCLTEVRDYYTLFATTTAIIRD